MLNLLASFGAVAGYAIDMLSLKNAGILMGIGMLGIFIVIIAIYLVVLLLTKAFPEKRTNKTHNTSLNRNGELSYG